VVTGGIYAVGVWGYRPGWADLRFGLAVGVVYSLVVMLLNIVSSLERGVGGALVMSPSEAWHYGYVGPFADPPAFGGLHWFSRSLVMMGCAAVAMSALTVPFVLGGARAGGRVRQGGGGLG
jgi:hypothetical protein